MREYRIKHEETALGMRYYPEYRDWQEALFFKRAKWKDWEWVGTGHDSIESAERSAKLHANPCAKFLGQL